jgi:hypothetical protein
VGPCINIHLLAVSSVVTGANVLEVVAHTYQVIQQGSRLFDVHRLLISGRQLVGQISVNHIFAKVEPINWELD